MHHASARTASRHGLRCSGAAVVLFEAGSATITDDANSALTQQAAWLKQHPNAHVTIAGNGDDRGTEDYNFALGYRRAGADRNILIEDGIENDRITVVSYGGERTGPARISSKVPFGSVLTSVRCGGRRK